MCDEKYLGRTDRRTEVKQYTPFPFGEQGYKKTKTTTTKLKEVVKS
jgi:hypothetical protein